MDEFDQIFAELEAVRNEPNSFVYKHPITGETQEGIGEAPLNWGEYPTGVESGTVEANDYDAFRSQFYPLPHVMIEGDLGEESKFGLTSPEVISMSQNMPEDSQLNDPNWISASRLLHDYMHPERNSMALKDETGESFATWGINFMTAFDYNFSALAVNTVKLNNAPPEVAKAMYYLMETADRDGMTLKNFGKGALAMAVDPFNLGVLATFGIGVAGKYVVQQVTKMGFKELLKNIVVSAPTKASMATGAEAGFLTMADNLARQNVKVDADVQDEIDPVEAGVSAVAGTVLGDRATAGMASVLEGGRRMLVGAGKEADNYLANNPDTGTTLNMGADPTRPIAEGLSSIGKALDETTPKVDTSYRIQHTPNPEGARLDDMTGGGDYFPDDIYSINGLRIYGDANNKFDRESFDAIQSVKGKPDAEVTIYRAVPNEDNINTINSGDFVTLSREYAEMHGASGYGVDGQDAGKIIEAKVKVKHLRSDGNDLNEFGYFPENKGDVARAIIPTEEKNGIIAFHGSGADFDKFELSKIGTGEGNQAYGYGLYFTDTESIAKFYRNTVEYQNKIKGRNNLKYKDRFVEDLDSEAQSSDPYQRALLKVKGQLDYHTGNPQVAIQRSIRSLLDEISENKNNNIELSTGVSVSDYITKNNNETVAELKKLDPKLFSQETGKTYQVNIKAYKQELINYDTSLKEQTRRNQLILRPYYEKYEVAETADFGDLLEKVYRHLPQDEFAEQLSRQGIKGLFYKAGRTNTPDSKATNFVIFDDEIIDVMKKYGIVGAIGVSAMNDNDNVNSQEVTDGNT